MSRIPLVDLAAQHRSMKQELDAAIARVVERGDFILGREVHEFEQAMASYIGVSHAVGVASGTDALHLALLACGVGEGDEVITTPFTFVATAETISKCGARPVFVDIDPESFNIDPGLIEPAITESTKAIVPVHLFGRAADMGAITDISCRHGLRVIEDCAQTLGAEWQGQKVGSFGKAGCFSFFPSKMLGALGDGGMVVTNDGEVAERVRMLRDHGCKEKYHHVMPGFNSRLDTLQAAVLLAKLSHLNDWIEARRKKARLYAEGLRNIAGVAIPQVPADRSHVFNYYTVRVGKPLDRNALREGLAACGVRTAVYYPLCLHLQPLYEWLGYGAAGFPRSEEAQAQALSLPMYPELPQASIELIARETQRLAQQAAVSYGAL